MQNLDIRVLVAETGLTYKQIAGRLGISQSWLSTLLSKALSGKNRLRILDAIEELKNEQMG